MLTRCKRGCIARAAEWRAMAWMDLTWWTVVVVLIFAVLVSISFWGFHQNQPGQCCAFWWWPNEQPLMRSFAGIVSSSRPASTAQGSTLPPQSIAADCVGLMLWWRGLLFAAENLFEARVLILQTQTASTLARPKQHLRVVPDSSMVHQAGAYKLSPLRVAGVETRPIG